MVYEHITQKDFEQNYRHKCGFYSVFGYNFGEHNIIIVATDKGLIKTERAMFDESGCWVRIKPTYSHLFPMNQKQEELRQYTMSCL